MKTNSELLQAVKLVLMYSKLDAETIELYSKMVENYAANFDISKAKSIRFEGNLAKVGSVCTPRSHKIHTEVPDGSKEPALVVEYFVREEEQPRYAFFSEKFTQSFAVRFFKESAKLNKLIKNNKIEVLDTFKFKGCTFAHYVSENSTVDRYAICANEIDFDESDFSTALATTSTGDDVQLSHYFGG